MINRTLRLAALAAVGVLSVSAAKADVEFERRGQVAYLHSHRIRPGDEEQVRAFLDGPEGQGVRIIYFDSRGGNPPAAMAIGQLIRERGLDTGFHPRDGNKCASACTDMFMGGVHRYYVGGGRVRDAANTRVGLGFHMPNEPTQEGEETANAYYRAMGAPGATSLRYHIYPRETLDQPYEGVGRRNARVMYFTGSRTAVRTGVATGVSAPSGERD